MCLLETLRLVKVPLTAPSLGFGASGLNFGVDFNKSTGQSELFTNAAITAGGDLDIISGLDTVLMGANVKAKDIYMDVGNDLIVQSRQNTSDSESFGFSFSTDGAFSLNISEAERRYTDTPTTIVAQDRLSIYTGATTYLLGAVLQSEVGNLELDTGNLIFDNFNELDRSSSFGISGSISVADFTQANVTNPDYINQSDIGGSWAYESTHAITYATIGAGTIRVRDVDDYDFSGLNRDVDHVQVITSHKKFVREIPGINLKRLNKQIQRSIDLIEAYSTHLTDEIRTQGEHAVKLFRESVRQGFDPDELRALASSPEFRAAVRERKNFFEAVAHYGSVEAIPADTKAAIALGYTVLLGKASNFEGGSFVIPCQTSSEGCQIALDEFNEVFDLIGADLLLSAMKVRLGDFSAGEPTFANLVNGEAVASLLETLLWCAAEAPHIFVQLTQNTEARALLEQYGQEVGSGADAFFIIADKISSGANLEDVVTTFNENIDPTHRFKHGLVVNLVATIEGAIDTAIFAANVSGLNGDAAQKETLDATIAILEYVKENPGEVTDAVTESLKVWGAAVARGDAEALGQLTGGAITALIPAGVVANALRAPKYIGKFDADIKIDEFDARRSVDELEVGHYSDLAARSIKDGLTPDHIPSFAAVRTAIQNVGIDLDQRVIRALKSNSTCIVVRTCDHLSFSRTFGGRNNPALIDLDANDLRRAANADLDTWEPVWHSQGWTQQQIDDARSLVHDRNRDFFSEFGIEYGNF